MELDIADMASLFFCDHYLLFYTISLQIQQLGEGQIKISKNSIS